MRFASRNYNMEGTDKAGTVRTTIPFGLFPSKSTSARVRFTRSCFRGGMFLREEWRPKGRKSLLLFSITSERRRIFGVAGSMFDVCSSFLL
ncbi:unnamed protein product [Ectocarpus sp. 6 AP-2014]